MRLQAAVSSLIFLLAAAIGSAQRREPATYAVWLREDPVGPRLAPPARSRASGIRLERPVVTQAVVDTVVATQAPIRRAAATLGLPIVGSTHTLVNAVFVKATPEQAAQLRGLPGVRGVVRMRRFKMKLDTAAALVSAPDAWQAVGGISNAGAGFVIGILDSGIDNTHPAFQDPSLTPPTGFPKALPQNLPYTNSKIIVARSYVGPALPVVPSATRPDDVTPRDRAGHGTMVAMIAAGRSVTDPSGRTLTGIAPKAYLGNYKITGSTDIQDFIQEEVIYLAMQDAIADGMDIINLSIGSPAVFGPDDTGAACGAGFNQPCDLLASAITTATENFGVLVVVAAGNEGDAGSPAPTPNTIASPATAYDAIAVGATTNSKQLFSTLSAAPGAPPALQPALALLGNGPRPAGPLTLPMRTAESTGNDGLACDPLPAGSLTGRAVLVLRGTCEFEQKVINAAAAGAAAVVVYNRDGQDVPISMTGLVSATIPAAMIGHSAGVALRSFASATPSATVTLDPKLVENANTPDQVTIFSSRGPNIDDQLKPDLVAPGSFIYSATQSLDPNGGEYDPSRFASFEGTSFSAPIVAGAAALVMQQNPGLDPILIKSALVNTASTNVQDRGQPARVTAVGGGKLNAKAAVNPGAVVDSPTISFGTLDSTVRFPFSGTLQVGNVGTNSDTFRVEVQQRDPDSNLRLTVNGGTTASVTVPGRQFGQVTVAANGRLPAPGFYEGVLKITNNSGSTNLHVPYQYMVARGQPSAIFPVMGDGAAGTAGQPSPELLAFKVVDDLGLPVAGVPVTFRVVDGGGQIVSADTKTDIYGIAAADPDLGPTVGPQTFSGTAGSLTVNFVATARAAPFIADSGVVNGASFASGQKVAPGSIISIFGSNLSELIRSAVRLPLPLALGHVSISFDQVDAGLSIPGRFFFVSPGQLNVQVPWELTGQSTVSMKVRIDDSISNIYTLQLSDSAPGIFEYTAGSQKLGVVTHANGALVTAANPAQAGETVVVYATGVGPVDQPQATGEAALADPLARTKQTPQVTVAGTDAFVFFSGLAPNFVGLNQLNVTIPAGTPSGVQQLVITSNSVASNTVNIPIR